MLFQACGNRKPQAMPDHTNFDFGFPAIPTPPAPATQLWPSRARPEIIVDQYRVMLADPDGNLIGQGTEWGRGNPLSRVVYAQRNSARDF